MHCWYWVADFCEDNGITFIPGHALYMRAIHGGKTKNDRSDSYKIATLMRSGNFPLAYATLNIIKHFEPCVLPNSTQVASNPL